MLAYVLDQLGTKPSAAIGGAMQAYGGAALFGSGEYFVAEADESDGSLLKYKPYVGVLTNVDQDHMEFFKNQTQLEAVFQQYLNRIDKEGYAVIGWDHPTSRRLGSEFTGNRLAYGFIIGADVRGVQFRMEHGESRFLAVVERDQVDVRLKTLGRHNVQNALCVLAVCRALELDVKRAGEALAQFPGVARRLSLVVDRPDIRVYDDYAHNPGKIAACITSLKEAYPDRQLQVIYQIHRYSRLDTMYEDMLGAVAGADLVHILPVYAAGETTTRDYGTAKLAGDMQRLFSIKAAPAKDFAGAAETVQARLVTPAVVLTVGAGDVWKAAELLKEAYA
jgi:UDP-N-acetylmuramate--alanine ligase